MDGLQTEAGHPRDGNTRSGEPFYPERLSTVLRKLARREQETLAIAEVSRALKDRGFGALMILMAAPNLIPMPPGTSTVFGVPLIFVAVQLIIGYRKPLLPRRMREYEFSMAAFRGMIDRMEPWIMRFERVALPRAWVLPQRMAERLIGGVGAFLGNLLFPPSPPRDMLPGLAAVLLCLGMGGRDGLWVLAGLATALIGIGVIIGVLATAGLAVMTFF